MNFDFPQKHSHELVLFFYPSPGLNWTNPRGLTFTTAWNKLLGLPRSIGHVSILVRSPNRTLHTGMTQSKKNEGRLEVLWQGYGLGILLHSFAGQLEDSEKLAAELTLRARKAGKLSYLRVAVNESITTRLFAYLDEYSQSGYAKYYGMRNRPLYGEGSGCSAFAASFLETAGVLREDFTREWTRTFNIPQDLIGGPSTGKKVSVLAMLRRADRWAQEGEPHAKGFFWDPDLMHAWLERTYANPSADFTAETWANAHGIAFDAKTAIAPTGKIFKHH